MNPDYKICDFFKTKYCDEILIDEIYPELQEENTAGGCTYTLSYFDIILITGRKGFFN